MTKRIVILVHETTTTEHVPLYFISQLACCWREWGFKTISMTGPDHAVSGDLLFMHVDLSRVPDRYVEAANRFPATVNARVVDIRKSVISRQLLGRDSDWDGPVIVKTDLNCAGLPEERYERSRGTEHPHGVKSSADYPIFAGLKSVPGEYFENPRLVVEKFLPEKSGREYCMRSYNFLGDAEDCFLAWSDRPVISMRSIKRMERIEVHPQIRQLREELGFDYGKLDYVVRDGQAILFDANKTPGCLPLTDAGLEAMLSRRAEGIRGFLR